MSERQLLVVFPVQDNARQLRAQDTRDELRELSVAQHGGFAKFLYPHLIDNFASRGERLNEHRLLVGHAVRNGMKISQRERQIFRERSVVVDDAENPTPGAVWYELLPAISANGMKTEITAADIDLAGDALA